MPSVFLGQPFFSSTQMRMIFFLYFSLISFGALVFGDGPSPSPVYARSAAFACHDRASTGFLTFLCDYPHSVPLILHLMMSRDRVLASLLDAF